MEVNVVLRNGELFEKRVLEIFAENGIPVYPPVIVCDETDRVWLKKTDLSQGRLVYDLVKAYWLTTES